MYDSTDETFTYLAKELGKLEALYIHIVDHSAMGAPDVPHTIKKTMASEFGGTIILSGGYDKKRAEADLEKGLGQLVAFGRPFTANPDLVERFKSGAELAEPNPDLFYTPGPEGYTDFPNAR
jgi:N-ethylmaleimide reductase